MTPNLYWIPGPWRGRLAISARPRGGEWLEDEVRGWRAAGIDIVVSLLEPEEEAQLQLLGEGGIASEHGIQYISLPIPDRAAPRSAKPVISLLTVFGEALDQGKHVAVHCRQGIGRSGLIAVSLLMRAGSRSGIGDSCGERRGWAARARTEEQRIWLGSLHVGAGQLS